MAPEGPRGGPTRAQRAKAEAVVARHLATRLEPEGFRSDGAHLVRRAAGVVEVVELQHSIYGTRITANLGLDLLWLRPFIRWIPRPAIGPHAHDCLRWIRVGLVEGRRRAESSGTARRRAESSGTARRRAESSGTARRRAESSGTARRRADCWWTYEEEDAASLEIAAAGLAERVKNAGLGWVERERTPEAFLRHAEKAVERSRTRVQPEGGYHELRLLAAVRAWRGEEAAALEAARLAGEQWEEERARLALARKIYRRRHPEASTRLPPVPNLQAELERLIAPTTGARVLRRAGARIERPQPSTSESE